MTAFAVTPELLARRFAFADADDRIALRLRIGPPASHADLTFRELGRDASRVAAALEAHGLARGDRVALLLPHSRELVTAFFGALYAGLVPAIVAWPTAKMDPEKYRRNVSAVVKGLDADWLVTDTKSAAALGDALGRTHVVDDGALARGDERAPARAATTEGTLFIQFSGGTTGTQKSVAITADHLAAQLTAYASVLQPRPEDAVASWLPLYHDMGLIACLVMPFVLRIPVTMFAPMEWVMDPRPLLESIGRDRTTLAWLPNFAFAFMAQKFRGDVASLDLSSMRAIVNCSEPVRAESMDAFSARFAAAGLSASALHACYAMAEATFAVTQTTPQDPPRRLRVELDALQRGAVVPSNEGARTLVSCGRTIPTMELRVVGDDGSERPPGSIGELWLRGPSIMDDYLAPKGAAAAMVRGAFTDGWYRTGDFGAVVDEHVYIVGRKKDVIIVGGVNVFPEDIEAAVSRVDGVRAGRVVALGIESPERGTEQVVVVAEVSAAEDLARADAVAAAARQATMEACGIGAWKVFVVPPQWIVKSTAGKVARSETRARLLARWDALLAGDFEMSTNDVIDSVRKVVSARIGGKSVRDDTPLVSGGLIDSMSIVDVILDLEQALGVHIPPGDVQPDDFDSIDRIVATVGRFR